MYEETVHLNNSTRVTLSCSLPRCLHSITVTATDHADAQAQLYKRGWRLDLTNRIATHLCPVHAYHVARRLARRFACLPSPGVGSKLHGGHEH